MVDILPDDAPAPRLCHLIKWPDFDGYGFNLHAERSNPGQFVGKIDEGSPAQLAGLKEGDRIVEVNGVNINNENHRQVVERIKSEARETRLLVVDPETDAWYQEQDIVVKSSQLNVVYIRTPVPRPQTPAEKQANEEHVDQQHQATNDNDTSDFNDDSIEQPAPALPNGQSPEPREPTPEARPPMSPDSGKGDDEPPAAGELSIEAEINRQAPSANTDDRLEIVGQYQAADRKPASGEQANTILADEPHPASNGQQNHTTTETIGGITKEEDDDHNHDDDRRAADKNEITNANSVITTTSISESGSELGSQSVASNNELANELQPEDSDGREDRRQMQPDSLNHSSSGNQTDDTSTELHSSLKQPTSQSQLDELGCQPDSLSNELVSSRPAGAMKMQIQPQNLQPNARGLNLNMTASEMRELIARRKKFDAKKAQMNIRQKYEIIQQM